MKRIAIALLLTIIAASAVQAATIEEIQMGVHAPADIVDVSGVVVVGINLTSSNGYYIAEAPYGAYNGVYAYGPNADVAIGDVIDITGGEVAEYYDLTELKTFDAIVTVVGSMTVPAPSMMTADELYADPEPFEGCLIMLTDGMIVTELGSYGEWTATTLGGTAVLFDDYMFDVSTVMVDDCYDNVTGCLDYTYGAYKLQAQTIVDADCAVETETSSFGSVKSLYR
jgi:large repetitive protein